MIMEAFRLNEPQSAIRVGAMRTAAPTFIHGTFIRFLAIGCLTLGTPVIAVEGVRSWTGAGGAGSPGWEDARNWADGDIPGTRVEATNADTAFFGVEPVNRVIEGDAGRLVHRMDFANGSPGYTVTGETLRVAGGGRIHLAGGSAEGGEIIFEAPLVIAPAPAGSEARMELADSARNNRFILNGPIAGGETSGTVTLETTGNNFFSSEINGPLSDGAAAGGLRLHLSHGSNGTLTLTGTNTHSGGTLVEGARMVLGDDSALGTGVVTWNAGMIGASTRTLANDFELNGTLGLVSSTITFDGAIVLGTIEGIEAVVINPNTGTQVFNGVISDGGHSTPLARGDWGGIVVINGANTFDGGYLIRTTSTARLTRLGHDRALGTGTLTIEKDAEGAFAGEDRTLANQVAWNGHLHFASTNYTFDGDVVIGTEAGSNARLSANDGTRIFNGVISDGGFDTPFTLRGPGRVILSNDNEMTGTVTVEEGGLQVGDGGGTGLIGSAAVVLGEGSGLRFERTGSYSLVHAISGEGDVRFLGADTVTLSGNSTYRGTTSVGEGITLLLDGSHRGGGNYTIAGGGALGGTGSVELEDAAILLASGAGLTGSMVLKNAEVILASGARLIPGDANTPGVLQVVNGSLDIREQSGSGAGELVFRLGENSDRVRMDSSLLIVGSGLQFQDFTFKPVSGFTDGHYPLFDARVLIGDLGANTTGRINGLEAEILIDGNTLKLRVGP